MFLQNLSSTRPPIFSMQRGLDVCSPGPQAAEHLSQSIKSQRNAALRGVRCFNPNEYFNVTFSFGRAYRRGRKDIARVPLGVISETAQPSERLEDRKVK